MSHVIQFLLRRETLQLYRQFLRVVMDVEDDEYRLQLKGWIRSEFEMAISGQDNNDEVGGIAYKWPLTSATLGGQPFYIFWFHI